MRLSGLPTVGPLQSGTHIVQFYRHARQLIETHAAFCEAGLKSEEFCLWLIAPPLVKSLAELELDRRGVNVDEHVKQGQLEFVPHTSWYFDGEAFSMQRTLERSKTLMLQVKARGFTGIRICGDLSWLKTDRDWNAFLTFEHAIHQAVIGSEVIGLCSYPIRTERHIEQTELMQSHHAVLRPLEQSWEYVPTTV